MQTHSLKSGIIQREPSEKSAQRTGVKKIREFDPILDLQRRIGGQAVQRLAEANGGEAGRGSATTGEAAAIRLIPPGRALPMWRKIELGLHNSPPATGRGSRSSPLVYGSGSTQPVRGMRRDAWYRSPVNPNNPVLVWTDGTTLFFGPSNAAVTAGRTALPDASFSPLPGYHTVEIRWDRLAGQSFGGPLLVIARKPHARDLVVGVNEDLEQTTSFQDLGVTVEAFRQVTREGTEFLRSDDDTVPREISGAPEGSAIQSVRFSNGFFRYRFGGSDDLYVAQGRNPAVFLVIRRTGNIRRTFLAGSVRNVVPTTGGVVGIETATGTAETVTIDLRTNPATITTRPGHATGEAGYAPARARLTGMGVVIEENGIRFRVQELNAVADALTSGGNRGLRALQNFHALPTSMPADPILLLEKRIGPHQAVGDAGDAGAFISIQEPFDAPSDYRLSTVRHEITHVIMDAVDAVSRNRMSLADRTAREREMGRRAAEGRRREAAPRGTVRLGERGAGDPRAGPSPADTWRIAVGNDPDLAGIFIDLLATRAFIPDPEGTGDRRGVALSDQSRYSTAPSGSGHPSDTVGEFAAAFVVSATLFRRQFVAAVTAAEAAGNRGGSRAGSDLRGLYRRAWARIDSLYVPLGANPF